MDEDDETFLRRFNAECVVAQDIGLDVEPLEDPVLYWELVRFYAQEKLNGS